MPRNQPTDVRNRKASLLGKRSHGCPKLGVGHVEKTGRAEGKAIPDPESSRAWLRIEQRSSPIQGLRWRAKKVSTRRQ